MTSQRGQFIQVSATRFDEDPSFYDQKKHEYKSCVNEWMLFRESQTFSSTVDYGCQKRKYMWEASSLHSSAQFNPKILWIYIKLKTTQSVGNYIVLFSYKIPVI